MAETTYVPFESKPDAATVRLIVRRVKPTPGSQLALFANYSYHAFITDRDGDTLYLEADHRRHAEIENAIRDLKYGVGLNHLPSGRFPANPEPAEGGLAGRPGDRPQPGPLDGAHRSGPATGDHQDPAAAFLLPGRTAHPLGPPSHPASSPGLALEKPVQQRSGETARPPTPFLTAPDRPPDYPQAWLSRARLGPACLLLPSAQLISPSATTFGRQQPLSAALTLRTQSNLYGSRLCSLFPEPLIPALAGATASLRWIRGKPSLVHSFEAPRIQGKSGRSTPIFGAKSGPSFSKQSLPPVVLVSYRIKMNTPPEFPLPPTRRRRRVGAEHAPRTKTAGPEGCDVLDPNPVLGGSRSVQEVPPKYSLPTFPTQEGGSICTPRPWPKPGDFASRY